MKKSALMIHTIQDDFLKIKLENYILTFDDGLYNHFYYYPKLKLIQTEKIFFISTNIICNTKQSKSFLSSEECHKKAFMGNKEDFMNLEQLEYLSKERNVFIGGHSHFHKNLNTLSNLNDKVNHIKKDTELMLEWFHKNLNLFPNKFCFPYNDDLNGLYKSILMTYGINEFYGKERISIEGCISS
jgi:hypothetical protein